MVTEQEGASAFASLHVRSQWWMGSTSSSNKWLCAGSVWIFPRHGVSVAAVQGSRWKMESAKRGRKSLLHAERLTCNVFMLEDDLGRGAGNRWKVPVAEDDSDMVAWCLPVWEKHLPPASDLCSRCCQVAVLVIYDNTIVCNQSLEKTSGLI